MALARGASVRCGLALALVLPVLWALSALAGRARIERADLVFANGSEVSTLDPAAISGQAENRVASATK